MRVLRSEITIGSFFFDFVTEVEVISSWDLLTDTATITIPKNLRYRGTDGKNKKALVRGTQAVFKRGDAVIIKCGYYPTPAYGDIEPFNTIFEGFVTEVSPKRPITIQCQDAAYDLKRMRIEKYSTGKTPKDLGEVLEEVAVLYNDTKDPDAPEFDFIIKAEVMSLGETVLENVTYADFLDELKRAYGLKVYVRGETLNVGFARITQNTGVNSLVPDQVVELQFGRDIISDSNLTYRNAADMDINLIVISIDENNDRIQAEAGQPWGSTRNLYYYKKDLATLQKIADAAVNQFKFDGYRGSFTVFGIPMVRHGDAVRIRNNDIADTVGEYLLEKVVTTFGVNGFRQEIYMSARINQTTQEEALFN